MSLALCGLAAKVGKTALMKPAAETVDSLSGDQQMLTDAVAELLLEDILHGCN